jgi:glucosylceramidase
LAAAGLAGRLPRRARAALVIAIAGLAAAIVEPVAGTATAASSAVAPGPATIHAPGPSTTSRTALAPHAPKVTLGPRVSIVETSANLRQALTPQPAVSFHPGAGGPGPVIVVDPAVRYQRFRAVGAAMTDSSAWLIQTGLTAPQRGRLMAQLFSRTGLHLGFLRVPMGASDFSAQGVPYTYDDMPTGQTDPSLANFSIGHDRAYILPALQAALAENPRTLLLASPWSAPGWMKDSGVLSNPGNLIGTLQPSDYAPMAAYFVKFLQAYRAAGVPIWGVTPQNEPGQNTTYPGMNLSEAGEATFVTRDLAPALRSAHLPTRIYGYDNSWYGGGMGYAYALALGPAARDLAGIATHCYFGTAAEISGLHRVAPGLDQVVSECSPGSGLAFTTSQLEIAATRNWASAVTLWNLALDPAGGPVQPPNYGCHGCTGVVTVDPVAHSVVLTRDYYQLGQFSKYVQPGAVRIASNTLVRDHYFYPSGLITTPGVDDVAFQNPDGTRVLIAYADTMVPVSFAVRDGTGSFRYRLSPRATATFTWKPAG